MAESGRNDYIVFVLCVINIKIIFRKSQVPGGMQIFIQQSVSVHKNVLKMVKMTRHGCSS